RKDPKFVAPNRRRVSESEIEMLCRRRLAGVLRDGLQIRKIAGETPAPPVLFSSYYSAALLNRNRHIGEVSERAGLPLDVHDRAAGNGLGETGGRGRIVQRISRIE